MRTYGEGICMVCNTRGKIRHLDLYVKGIAGLWICRSCEQEIIESIRRKTKENGEIQKILIRVSTTGL